jgi:hypothetical protein
LRHSRDLNIALEKQKINTIGIVKVLAMLWILGDSQVGRWGFGALKGQRMQVSGLSRLHIGNTFTAVLKVRALTRPDVPGVQFAVSGRRWTLGVRQDETLDVPSAASHWSGMQGVVSAFRIQHQARNQTTCTVCRTALMLSACPCYNNTSILYVNMVLKFAWCILTLRGVDPVILLHINLNCRLFYNSKCEWYSFSSIFHCVYGRGIRINPLKPSGNCITCFNNQ